MKTIGFLFLFAASALAQLSCPVKLKAEFWRNCNNSDQMLNASNCINFKLTNLLADKIEHVEIVVTFDETSFTYLKPPRPVAFIYTSDEPTEARKRREYLWNLSGVSPSGKFQAWISKLTFENGSYWKDDGSKMCSVSRK